MVKAVIFDFDGTLTPDVAPKFEILEKSGIVDGVANPRFATMMGELAEREKIDIYEAMIKTILKVVSAAGFELTNENIGLGAEDRIFNPGVEKLLRVLKDSGIKSYILSSGAKAYLAQTRIAPLFTEIYASSLIYDDHERVNGIENVMTMQQKAETLRNLAREINGDEDDCRGMFYVGDGPTDANAMNFMKERGGKNIMVYINEPRPEALKICKNGLVDLLAPANYAADSKIYQYIFNLPD